MCAHHAHSAVLVVRRTSANDNGQWLVASGQWRQCGWCLVRLAPCALLRVTSSLVICVLECWRFSVFCIRCHGVGGVILAASCSMTIYITYTLLTVTVRE
eukprot:scaffold5293_cov114-Isochrysis_galbana.AAC.7